MAHDPRFLRQKILQVLNAKHPHCVTDEELLILLGDQNVLCTAVELASELTYLADWPDLGDGYIRLTEKRRPRTGERYFVSQITPRGINQVERLADPDPMIGE